MGGIINISKLKVPPEKHELETARYFADLGYDIEFIPPNHTPQMHTPDIVMDGITWEIKSPTVRSRRTIENNLRQAMMQSDNIIFDMRRIHMSDNDCIVELEHRFNQKKAIRRLWIIKKNLELVKFSR